MGVADKRFGTAAAVKDPADAGISILSQAENILLAAFHGFKRAVFQQDNNPKHLFGITKTTTHWMIIFTRFP